MAFKNLILSNGVSVASQEVSNSTSMFGGLVKQTKLTVNQSTDINIGKLVTEVDKRGKNSVGLSLNGLTAENPKPVTNENPTENPAFNTLLNHISGPVQQKFALQPIPENMDISMLPNPNLVNDVMEDVNSHLSKSNSKNDSSNKKLNNWFSRMIEQKGEDYFSANKVSVEEVGKNAEKIFDDMISGRIDYNKQGQYVIHPIVIETLINYCSNKLAINKAIQYSLGYVYNDYTNRSTMMNDSDRIASLSIIDDSLSRNITQAIAIVNQDIGVYELLYNKLTFVNATKNASSLFSLTNDLNNYKKQIKKRY